MKIELKVTNYSKFASQETHCYAGKLFVDGKHVADVSNDGQGGADRVYWKRDASVTESEVNEWLKVNVQGKEFYGRTIDVDLEIFCGNAVNEWLNKKEADKVMRAIKAGRAVYVLDEKNTLRRLSWKGVKKVDYLHIQYAVKNRPQDICLNTLPTAQARHLIEQALGA